MHIASIIGWIVFGFMVGVIARWLVPGRNRLGCLPTIGLGIAGSVTGGALAHLLQPEAGPYQPAGWLMSIVGAIVVLVAFIALTGRASEQ